MHQYNFLVKTSKVKTKRKKIIRKNVIVYKMCEQWQKIRKDEIGEKKNEAGSYRRKENVPQTKENR